MGKRGREKGESSLGLPSKKVKKDARVSCEKTVLPCIDVLRMTPQLDVAPPTVRSDGDLVASMVHPLTRDEFLESYVVPGNRALVIKAGSAYQNRVDELIETMFHGGDAPELIQTSASLSETTGTGVSVWLPPTPTADSSDSADVPIDSMKAQDPSLIHALFLRGASLYMRASQETCDELAVRAASQLGMPLCYFETDGAGKGEVEIFLASRRGAVTPAHTDFQINLTLQLRGQKKWRAHAPTPEGVRPLRGRTPHFANVSARALLHQSLSSHTTSKRVDLAPPEETSEGWSEVTLEPGDFLFHPPGLWHRVECTEAEAAGACLSVNISLVATTWADVLASSLRQHLWSNAKFRAPVGMVIRDDAHSARYPWGDDPASMRAALLEMGVRLPFSAESAVAPVARAEEVIRRVTDELDEETGCVKKTSFEISPGDEVRAGFAPAKSWIWNPLATMLQEATSAEGQKLLRVLVNYGNDELLSTSQCEIRASLKSARAVSALEAAYRKDPKPRSLSELVGQHGIPEPLCGALFAAGLLVEP